MTHSSRRPVDAQNRPLSPTLSDEAPTVSGSPDRRPEFWRSFDWKLILAMLLPVLLETLDYTVVATVQSQISFIFNALQLESYVGIVYLLASTVFLPFFASLADIYGRHFGLQLSLLLFLLGSALSTGAQNMAMMLAGRGFAGVGAAGLLTVARTVMSDTTSLDKNNVQQSILFLFYSLGFSLGPLIGGYLVAANFRWVFAINLPCTLIAMILCFIILRKRPTVRMTNEVEKRQLYPAPMTRTDTWFSKLALIDWVGTFLFSTGCILVLLGFNWGPDDRWKSERVIVSLIVGVFFIVLCLLWEALLAHRPNGTSDSGYIQTRYTSIFRARAMLPLELFASYDMCITQYTALISGMIMFVMFYFVSIFATVVSGLSPSEAGIQLLYLSPGLVVGVLLAVLMVKRFRQPVYPIVAGNVLITIGVGLVQMAVQHDKQSQVDGFMALVGVGIGLNEGPLVIHARFTRPNHVAITNAVLLFFRAFGGSLGLAQCFTILKSKIDAYIAAQMLAGTLTSAELGMLESLQDSAGIGSLTASFDTFPSAVQAVVKDAFRNGVRWALISLIPWAGVACLSAVFLTKIEDGSGGAHVEGFNERSKTRSDDINIETDGPAAV